MYDLVADPYQMTNVHGMPAYATLEASLAASLDAVIPDPLPPCTNSRVLRIGDVVAAEPRRGVSVTVDVPLRSPARPALRSRSDTPSWPAAAGAHDVVLGHGTVVIPALGVTGFVPVTIRGDNTAEAPEQASVVLDPLPPDGQVSLGDGTGTVTVLDRARTHKVDVAVGDVQVGEGDGSSDVYAYLPVTLSGPAAVPINVKVNTIGGTAESGIDFRSMHTSFTIPAGAVGGIVQIALIGDRYDEPDETFTATITVTGAKVVRRTGTVTILDDDEE